MKYKKRYNKFNLQTKCRVCLTQSVGSMTGFSSSLKTNPSSSYLSVLTALEFVTAKKIFQNPKLPNSICNMCVELLKISYDFIKQFNKSEQELREEIQDKLDDNELRNFENLDNKIIPVEISIGSQKFDIKDLLIVEEEEQNNNEFQGFLSNLGKTISATFVRKNWNRRPPSLEFQSPDVVIEKISKVTTLKDAVIETDFNNIKENSAENFGEGHDLLPQPLNEEDVTTMIAINNKNVELYNHDADGGKCFTCYFCKKTLTISEAHEHNDTCKRKNETLKCFICLKLFVTKRRLLNHMNIVHFNIKKSPLSIQQGKYECYQCHKLCSSYGSLAYHVAKHQGRQFHCDICKQTFYTKHEVDVHKQSHNRNETIEICSVCGKRFHYQSGLFYHMKTHTNERKYVCKFCPKRFYTRNSINRHELIHTGGRPYNCNFCEKKFRSLGEEKKHELLHSADRAHKCNYCEMSFTQVHNLKVHVLVHGGDFRCKWCTRGFVNKDSLIYHMKQKHPLLLSKEEEGTVEIEAVETNEEGIDENQLIISTEEIEAIFNNKQNGTGDNINAASTSMLENNFFIVNERQVADLQQQQDCEKSVTDRSPKVIVKENILLQSIYS